MKKILKPLLLYFELTKIAVSLPVTFMAFAGFTMFARQLRLNALLLSLGVFFLAGAASVLNQIIEGTYDKQMVRTAKRPIPSGRIGKTTALALFGLSAIAGSFILLQFGYIPFFIGLITLCWYIGVYTFLKRFSAFAVIPGSLTGALPPLIGWTAAGGSFTHNQIIFLALFVFVWQIPHFWVLILMYGNEYKKAGFPVLTNYLTEKQLQNWTFIWICFALVISLIPLLWIKSLLFSVSLVLIITTAITLSYIFLIKKPSQPHYKYLFHSINGFMLTLLFLHILVYLIYVNI